MSNNWALWCPRAHNLCLPFRNEEDCTFPILAALLRVTGLVAECLYHSLCTASSHQPPPPQPPPALLDIPPPHVSSVKWKCRPIKNRQPEADHCSTYANVDTGKYHTRRGGREKKKKLEREANRIKNYQFHLRDESMVSLIGNEYCCSV